MTDATILHQSILDLEITPLMEKSYLDYALSVITDRALPDVRDGLKPVHRRILFAMHELRMMPGTAYKKSARVVGEVIGKYHPHGDSSVYNAAVYMAQPWAKRVPLVDGQGNFGSIDGDNPAAMRYTEMRLTKGGAAFFHDIEKNTVNYRENYDGSETEPSVLPVAYPNLWVNGSDGIAVGMATNILPHHPGETIDSFLFWMDNQACTVDDILAIMPAPDFPTGGIVHELGGFREALLTGKGRVRVRSKWHKETTKRHGDQLVIDEIPYRVNKAELVKKMGELYKEKILEDVSGLRDESSKNEIRVVLDLKKGAYPEVVFNQLVKLTELDKAYSYNTMALVNGSPKQLSIFDIFTEFLAFRREVIRRRVAYDLERAKNRLHLLSGLMLALGKLDDVIALIRASSTASEARDGLKALLSIDDQQAQAILDMKLQKLTSMEMDNLREEFQSVTAQVADWEDILVKPARVDQLIKDDALSAKTSMTDVRRSEISYEMVSVSMADLVKKEPCIIHFTHNGYVKRMPLGSVSTQNRYTQGKSGIQVGEDDYVKSVYTGNTHDLFMIWTASGKVLAKRVWEIPEGSPSQRGRHMRNLFEELQEPIAHALFVPDLSSDGVYMVAATANGKIKRTSLGEYAGSLRRGGIMGMNLEENDFLIGAAVCRDHDHIMLGASDGRTVRFEVTDEQLRPMGRVTTGVRGMRLLDGSKVLSLMVVQGTGEPAPTTQKEVEDVVNGVLVTSMKPVRDYSQVGAGAFLLCVGNKGAGKRTPVSEFPVHNRAGQGVMCFNINKKTGPLVILALVHEDEDLILATENKTNRVRVQDIRQSGRVTAGSFIIDVQKGKLVDVTPVPGELPTEEEGVCESEE